MKDFFDKTANSADVDLLQAQSWHDVDDRDGGVAKYLKTEELDGAAQKQIETSLSRLGVNYTQKLSSIDNAPNGTPVLAISGADAVKIARIQDGSFGVKPGQARIVGAHEQSLSARIAAKATR